MVIQGKGAKKEKEGIWKVKKVNSSKQASYTCEVSFRESVQFQNIK